MPSALQGREPSSVFALEGRARYRPLRATRRRRGEKQEASTAEGQVKKNKEEGIEEEGEVEEEGRKKKEKRTNELLGALPREERKLIAQSAGARGKSTPATKNFNQ